MTGLLCAIALFFFAYVLDKSGSPQWSVWVCIIAGLICFIVWRVTPSKRKSAPQPSAEIKREDVRTKHEKSVSKWRSDLQNDPQPIPEIKQNWGKYLETVAAKAEEARGNSSSGRCGPDITWRLDEDGLLTLSGSGPIPDYQQGENVFFNREKVKAIVVESGITAVGAYCFQFFSNLERVTLADTVERIGESALSFCGSLRDIDIPASVHEIGNTAFDSCVKLKRVFIHARIVRFGLWVFASCPAVTIYVEEGIIIPTAVNYADMNQIPWEAVPPGESPFISSGEGESGVEIVDSGECGEGITYTRDSSGTLRISGVGRLDRSCMIEMPWDIWNDEYDRSPWAAPGPDGGAGIVRVIIEEGITYVETLLFMGTNVPWPDGSQLNAHPDLKEISLPSTVTDVPYVIRSMSLFNEQMRRRNPDYPGIVITVSPDNPYISEDKK